jgi:hypothetical protein
VLPYLVGSAGALGLESTEFFVELQLNAKALRVTPKINFFISY